MPKFTLWLLLLFVLFSCRKKEHLPPIDHAVDLDGNRLNDSSLINPGGFLLSVKNVIEIDKKVFMAVHGFSASNFEWQEFHSFCRGKTDALVSRVLLGGHGRDYNDFRKATWQDWGAPVREEFAKLVDQGYRNITILASSTGAPLVLDLLRNNHLNTDVLKRLVFIDPIVVPANKQLSLAPIVGGTVIHYTESGLDPGEHGHWYKYRPQEALRQLNDLTNDIRKSLEKGKLQRYDVNIHIYKSEKDGSADPVSAVMLKEGLRNCTVTMVPSDLHVYTRLKGRPVVTENDKALQLKTFEEIYSMP